MQTHAAVISGFGINCENETKYCIEKTGGEADIIHINKLIDAPSLLQTYNFLIFPGGFSYADHLGAGKVFSNKLMYALKESIQDFLRDEKLIFGICNGFQMLAKLGILPTTDFNQSMTIIQNDSGKFEDRWVRLKINQNSKCIYTKGIHYLDLPVRHGEGKIILKNEQVFLDVLNNNLCPIQYVDLNGRLAGYPYNPNGSIQNIAGICDKSGRVFGLMPHPECNNHYTNCPLWIRGQIPEANGLKIFENAVNYISERL
ncbi:MAG: phosphoribosylformylglycinamidine synthase subunit PurQ [Candidatus Micrarchaeia archaeon]